MSGAVEFRSPSEARSVRPNLDQSCNIPLKDFERLIGRYAFPRAEWVRCQLEENGSVCRQEHGNGWIAMRKDGKEGFIGKDCAHAHFGADSNFAAEATRITRELRINDLVKRLKDRFDDPIFRSRLEAAVERQKVLRDAVGRGRHRWPEPLLLRLASMTKTGNRAVTIEIQYSETDSESGRETVTWQPAMLGNIAAPEGLNPARIREIAKRLEAVWETLNQAVPSNEQPEKLLRKWNGSLDDVDRCEAELEEVSASLQAFERPENLRLLCWLVRQDHLQLAVVRAVLELSGTGVVTEAAVRSTRRTWHDAIRAAHGDRDFRVAT